MAFKNINYVIPKGELDAIENEYGPLGVMEYTKEEIPMKIFTNGEYFEFEDIIESNNGFYIIQYYVETED